MVANNVYRQEIRHAIAPIQGCASSCRECDVAESVLLADIGVERWQYDFWYQIIMADLEDHPDQVDLSPLPNLDIPAASRYSAASVPLLHWFDKFNEGKTWREQVKAFNFLLAFHVSKHQFNEAIANGDIDDSFLDDDLPTGIAPYDDDLKRAASKCFDRRTTAVGVLARY